MKKLFALFLGLVMALSFCVTKPTNAETAWNGWERVSEIGFGQGSDIYTVHPVRHFVEFGDYLISAGGSTINDATIYKSTNGTDWEAISPIGLGDNVAIVTDMIVYKGGLFLSAAHNTKGAQIWRTYNAEISGWDELVATNFDPGNNVVISGFKEFNGDLYANGYIVGGTPLFDSVVYKSSDGISWDRVFGPGQSGSEMNVPVSLVEFNGKLFLGLSMPVGPTRIYTSTDGTDWNYEFGKGIDDLDNETLSLYVYDGVLYAGSGNENGPKIYKSVNGTSWEGIAMPEGINFETRQMIPTYGYNGVVYFTSMSNDYKSPSEIWQYNGTRWDQIAEPSFGNDSNYRIVAETYFNGYLYASAFNASGGSIWRKAIAGESTQTVQTLPETGANLN